MISPQPHHPDQLVSFPVAVDTTFATPDSPMSVLIRISLHRAPRQKCASCGNRRVGFWVGLGDAIKGPIMCARCSGIR